MSHSSSTPNNSSTNIQWKWLSNSNSHEKSHTNEWILYSAVENLMIEEAFQAKMPFVILDHYHVDFKQNVQISKKDNTEKYSVKRFTGTHPYNATRASHYISDPNSCEHSFGGQYGWIPPFIKEVRKYLKLEKNQLPSRDSSIIPSIVEKAARGIIAEGNESGQLYPAQWMAKQLIDRKDKGVREVWKCCAYLYSLEGFLYKKLNEIMRLVGSNQHEELWQNKIRTLGPFALLLWDDPINKKATTKVDGKILYRGTKLTDSQLESYRELCQKPEKYGSFQAFTSSSRNRKMVEQFSGWNVLFIMEVSFAFTADIQKCSDFPEEDEELIFPGVCFTVESMEFDEIKKKHVIYLNLKQRFNSKYSKIHKVPPKLLE